MSTYVFKPQLKDNIFYNLNPVACIIVTFVSGLLGFCMFFYGAGVNMQISFVIGVVIAVCTFLFLSKQAKYVKQFEISGPRIIKISPALQKISFDNGKKFYFKDINYVDIIDIENPIQMVPTRINRYFSIINVNMNFCLNDNQIISFAVQDSVKLIQILNLLRKSGVSVLDSKTELLCITDPKAYNNVKIINIISIIIFLFTLIFFITEIKLHNF